VFIIVYLKIDQAILDPLRFVKEAREVIFISCIPCSIIDDISVFVNNRRASNAGADV